MQQLQEQVDSLHAAISASNQRAEKYRQDLAQGDEIKARELQTLERKLRDKRALREHRREVRRHTRMNAHRTGRTHTKSLARTVPSQRYDDMSTLTMA